VKAKTPFHQVDDTGFSPQLCKCLHFSALLMILDTLRDPVLFWITYMNKYSEESFFICKKHYVVLTAFFEQD